MLNPIIFLFFFSFWFACTLLLADREGKDIHSLSDLALVLQINKYNKELNGGFETECHDLQNSNVPSGLDGFTF